MRNISSSILDDKKQNGIGIIPFLTSGFPNINLSKDIILNLLDEKLCSAIEVGIPFSDPIAEGKTIQKSSSVALKNGITIDNTLKMISEINDNNPSNTPIVSMGYYNPIFKMGLDNFFSSCKDAGVSGVIIADIPNIELESMQETANNYNVETIPLVPLNSSENTVNHACKIGQGFIYCVSVLGVTGTREKLSKNLNAKVNQVKESSKIPVAVGFGISKKDHIKELKNYADAAVIGSAIIDVISNSEKKEIINVVNFIKGLLE
jgi:tryptophan synthase alpha chain